MGSKLFGKSDALDRGTLEPAPLHQAIKEASHARGKTPVFIAGRQTCATSWKSASYARVGPSSVQWRLPAWGKAWAALELPQWVTPLPRVCGQPGMAPLCCAWAAAQHALRARQRRAPQVHRPAQPQDAHRPAALRARSGRHAPPPGSTAVRAGAGGAPASLPPPLGGGPGPGGEGAGDRLKRPEELEWRSQEREWRWLHVQSWRRCGCPVHVVV